MGKRVLIVEDNEFNRQVIASLLKCQFDVYVAEASDGVEALEMMAEEPPFDVVLMDIMMPSMGGYECFGKIVELYGEHRPTVIALTASTSKARNVSGLQFDAWWDKSNVGKFMD